MILAYVWLTYSLLKLFIQAMRRCGAELGILFSRRITILLDDLAQIEFNLAMFESAIFVDEDFPEWFCRGDWSNLPFG